MDRLPDELIIEILDYLDPLELLSFQRTSRRLLHLALDSSLWKFKCFERAPSAANILASNPNAISALTGALGGLSLGDSPPSNVEGNDDAALGSLQTRMSKRARALAEWDCTAQDERIDWYSEYTARHAPLTTEWMSEANKEHAIVESVGVFDDEARCLTANQDGSLGIWDIVQSTNGRRTFRHLGRSEPHLIGQDISATAGPSGSRKLSGLGVHSESLVVDSGRMRAYVGAHDVLNEIDLTTMHLVSQNKYAWNITAVSRTATPDIPLMVGTSFSLHMHDPRIPLKHLSLTKEVTAQTESSPSDSMSDKMIFLPNYSKNWAKYMPESSSDKHADGFYVPPNPFSPSPPRGGGANLERWAPLDPGPQSIVHRREHEILIAGRMPSIMIYDARTFPKLKQAIHSGARLSGLTYLERAPARLQGPSQADATLIAVGEYHGRGSLELYELPHVPSGNITPPFTYKNRQSASAAKLLSVTTQGARILVADGEGSLKWFERDGRGLARRWNINNYEITASGARLSGEAVVRKMLAFRSDENSVATSANGSGRNQGARGDGDVLVHTGEKVGIVTSKRQWESHRDLVADIEEKLRLDSSGETARLDEQERKEQAFSRLMRQALERQADERRFLSRFGTRAW